MKRSVALLSSIALVSGLLLASPAVASASTPTPAGPVPAPTSGGAPRGELPTPFTTFEAATTQAPPIAAPATSRVLMTVATDVPNVFTMPAPDQDMTVTFWRLDDAGEQYWYYPTAGTWTAGSGGGEWLSPLLPPGTYRMRVVPNDSTFGALYWPAARTWFEAGRFEVQANRTFNAGTIVLPPWTLGTWRIAGSDRYDTAALIAEDTRAVVGQIDTVYLASGMNYPDALAAGPASAAVGGTLLLTTPTALPAETRQELQRIKPTKVVVVGGPGAVSPRVIDAVRSAVPAAKITRAQGADRYATADVIVRGAFAPGNEPLAFIATGRSYADALSAGAAAASLGAPVILVDGSARNLPASTVKLLSDLGVETIGIVGGTGAVSASIERSLTARYGSGDVRRFAGADRYGTATAVNSEVFGFTDYAVVASGVNYPDALAGVPYAAALGAPVYLTPPQCIAGIMRDGLANQRTSVLGILGGTGAVSDNVQQLRLC